MRNLDPKRTLTQIQAEWIDTVRHARAKWAHRKDGGHSHRTILHATSWN